MMKKFLVVSATVLLLPTLMAQDSEDGFVRIAPDEFEWTVRESGTAFVIIEGNPAEEGFYIQRNRFPPGNYSTPHYHDQDRYITVISGTWYTATSADTELDDMVALPVGSYMKHPAGGWHFDGARDEETIVEIRGMGPVKTVRAE